MHDISTSKTKQWNSSQSGHGLAEAAHSCHTTCKTQCKLMSDGPLKHGSAVHIGKNNPIHVKVFELQQTNHRRFRRSKSECIFQTFQPMLKGLEGVGTATDRSVSHPGNLTSSPFSSFSATLPSN